MHILSAAIGIYLQLTYINPHGKSADSRCIRSICPFFAGLSKKKKIAVPTKFYLHISLCSDSIFCSQTLSITIKRRSVYIHKTNQSPYHDHRSGIIEFTILLHSFPNRIVNKLGIYFPCITIRFQ